LSKDNFKITKKGRNIAFFPFFVFNQLAVLPSNAWSEIKTYPVLLAAIYAILVLKLQNCIEKISAAPNSSCQLISLSPRPIPCLYLKKLYKIIPRTGIPIQRFINSTDEIILNNVPITSTNRFVFS